MNNTNNLSARASFDHARAMFVNAFQDKFQTIEQSRTWVNALKLSQNEIRLEVELNATANQFNFALTANQANTTGLTFNTENRLNLQDSLCVYEYAIFVGNPASRTDTLWNLRTYGNEVDFSAAQAAALNTTFYDHGSFRVTCNNDVIVPYRGLFNHLYKPQTQQTAALGAASPDDQIRGSEDSMITAEPNIVLIGSKGYIPQIILPTNLASVATFERAIVIFRGILAQNSTVVS